MVKKKKMAIVLTTVFIAIAIICILFFGIKACTSVFWNDIKEETTDILDYEEFLGENGKYKTNFGTFNDIFPNNIPQNANVEKFCYSYFDLADPCYLGYLVYTCEENVFEEECERLSRLESSEGRYIYGAKEFPYELLAVYADDYYGYIYALADREEHRLIYIELQFCNGFTDIDYKKIIDEKYLPVGFDATAKY